MCLRSNLKETKIDSLIGLTVGVEQRDNSKDWNTCFGIYAGSLGLTRGTTRCPELCQE